MNKFDFKKIIKFIVISIILLSTIYLIYNISLLNNIENFLRFIVNIVLILICIVLIILFIKLRKSKKIVIVSIISIIYSFSLYFISYNVNKVYSSISNITNNTIITSISLVTLSSNSNSDINNIGESKIGILLDEKNNEFAIEIINKNSISNDNIVKMNSYTDLINGLYDGSIDYVFLPTNYVVMFQNIEIFSNLGTDTKIIYTEEKIVKTEINNNQKLDKPFTVLIMGVDSELDSIKDSSFNGDALMLLTFNPNTLSATILSIPRDTYVPISCFSNQRKNKITHAAWYGESCMSDTIEEFLDIDIDYYVKINFKGVVKLVDALGGIEVDVPIDFCEQDSNRSFTNLICVDKGTQTLNGEEALALARHRKTINDIVRGQNQQLVIRGLMNSVKKINSLDTIYSILDTISNNMETNMSTNEILSLYNVAKDIAIKSKDSNIDEVLNIKKLYINGYDAYIYDYSTIDNQGTKLKLYEFVPYQGSLDEIINAMKINLGLIEGNISNEEVIGKDNYNGINVSLLPNFIGDMEEVATNYGNKKSIKINIKYVTTTNQNYVVGQIVNQSLPEGMDLEYISSDGLTIEVVEKVEIEKEENVICSLKENKEHKNCQIPNFVGENYSSFDNWTKINNYSYRIKVNVITENDSKYDSLKKGIIIEQKTSAKNIYDLIGGTIEITYISDELLDIGIPGI